MDKQVPQCKKDSGSHRLLNPLEQDGSDTLDDADDEGVAHEEGPLAIGDIFQRSVVVWEHVEALQLDGREATQGAPLTDGVLGPGRGLAPLTSDDGPGWTVQWVREGQRSLTEDVRVAAAALAGLSLGAL